MENLSSHHEVADAGGIDDRLATLQSELSAPEARERAAASIVEDYQGVLLSQAARVVGPAHAEDVVQETFMGMIKGAATFAGSYSLKAWLLGINRNRCVDELRRRGTRKEIPSEIIDEFPDSASSHSSALIGPHESVIRDESRRRVVSVLEKLPPRKREVLFLSLDGHSQSEIAAALGISLGTVKSRMKYAKDEVRGFEAEINDLLS